MSELLAHHKQCTLIGDTVKQITDTAYIHAKHA